MFRFPRVFTVALLLALISWPLAAKDALPRVSDAEVQPLLVHVERLMQAMEHLGMPLSAEAQAKLNAVSKSMDESEIRRTVQDILDPLCLMRVHINPESRVKVDIGPAKPQLVEKGWSQFLVKVHNEAGVSAVLRARSPQAAPVNNSPLLQQQQRQLGQTIPQPITPADVRDRWLDLQMFDGRPLNPTLSGQKLEYRIVQLYSRDTGSRAAEISFDVGQGSQDIGFRNDVSLTFNALPALPVRFNVKDENNQPTMAAFVITDTLGRIYPSQAKRLAPDFSFHPQVYRGDGESLNLPPGTYSYHVSRGPEYYKQTGTFQVKQGESTELSVKLARWVDPSLLGWWSGDHHIHAAGCLHYDDPSQGVHAPDMMRHCLGEDLKIGANLTWGPCFDYQKQFFTGAEDKTSQYPYILRYDVEVSGFGSHQSGHLVLLRLKDQMYPGGESKDHWPTLGLNTLRWAKKQGAVVGPAHSGWGLIVPGEKLPIYEVPPFDSIGANEYIMNVTHLVEGPEGKPVPAVDFLSTVDTPYTWEINMWYHTLNAGYRTRISGETDFPCIYGERVGLGRAYVKVDGKLTYDEWCEGVRKGRAYVGDGQSHLMDFTVGGVEVGSGESELKLKEPGTVNVSAKVAAFLTEQPDPAVKPQGRPGQVAQWTPEMRPYWHLERVRKAGTRDVKLELIVNGYPVAEKTITADGATRDVTFENVKIDRSSWVAMRVEYSSHTNPVFVVVGDKPIREKRSLEWCLKSVEQCWKSKQPTYAKAEQEDAKAAYEHARKEYTRRLAEAGR